MAMGKLSNSVLHLFLLFLFVRPGLAATAKPLDVPGFINIDCGAPGDSISGMTGLHYKSDKDLIDLGITHEIQPKFYANSDAQYRYLRSFPNGTRNCYTLKPEAGRNNKYLIRASFAYGNYDGKNLIPNFDVYLGVNFWATVQREGFFLDVFAIPSTDDVDVCLVNTGNGVPYISTLELRPLDNSIYDIVQNNLSLVTFARFDVGGSEVFRYPQDVYDRLWNPAPCDLVQNSSLISTNVTITDSNYNSYKLPQLMLQTACQSINSSFPLHFDGIPTVDTQYYFCFHLAEIEKLAAGQFRNMSLVFNDGHTITRSAKLEYLKPHIICSEKMSGGPNRDKLLVSATSASSLPPIVNGFEVFYFREASNPTTFLEDVNAIKSIKQQYKLSRNWQGDPCNPTQFLWDGLKCSIAQTSRIISLNLSSSKLTGYIAASISNLTALEHLDLSYNELKGPLPRFLELLPQLKSLNLIGNSFTGSIPDALMEKSKNGTLILSMNGSPELCLSPPCKKKNILIPILSSTIAVLILVCISCILAIFIRKREDNLIESEKKETLKLKKRQFNYLEVVKITNNFKKILGRGGFGKVYLGTLNDGTLVAVKLLSSSSDQGNKEFQAEAQLLMVIHHRNLVSLIGYCDEGDNKALIYEYMENGNLHQHISEKSVKVLNWMERLQIAIDAAEGLEYLHSGCKPPIIHRDMKTSNILLNKKMQAKIADFGLSRSLASETASHLSTSPAGTFGYIDPEIHSSGNFTKKSDIYSFGIVLLELITGKPAIIRGEEYNVHILAWIKPLIEGRNIENIVDSRLKGDIDSCCVWKAVEVAVSCTLPTSNQRPDMSFIVTELVECLKMVQERNPTQQDNDTFSFTSIGSDAILGPR